MVVKRGVIFSLMAILLAILFIALFWTMNAPRLDIASTAVSARIGVMDNFLQSSDRYVDDASIVSVRQSLAGMTARFANRQDGEPASVDEVGALLAACFVNGTFDDPDGGRKLCSLDGKNTSIIARLLQVSNMSHEELDINATFILEDISVEDWHPFELRLVFNLTTVLEDELKVSYARWNVTRPHEVIIPLDGLPDPLFSRYGQEFLIAGWRDRNLSRAEIPLGSFNKTEVAQVIRAREFVANTGVGPSYLQRLAGITTISSEEELNLSLIAGYETLIAWSNTTPAVQTNYRNLSFTDHQLFSGAKMACENGTGTAGSVGFTGFSFEKFRLDLLHAASYNLTGSIDYSTCG